jgi:hypothetical protein
LLVDRKEVGELLQEALGQVVDVTGVAVNSVRPSQMAPDWGSISYLFRGPFGISTTISISMRTTSGAA